MIEQMSRGTLRPEFELVCCCGRQLLLEPDRERVLRLLSQPLDWNRVLHTAREHRLLPLLHHSLQSMPQTIIPPQAALQLTQEARETARRSLWMTGELLRLLRQLQAAGVAAVPYKGPALATAAYGDVGLRPCSDLDILVREWDIPATRKLLLAQGYSHSSKVEANLTPRQRAHFERNECSYAFSHNALGPSVDLHWRFVPLRYQFQLDVDDLFKRLAVVTLGTTNVRSIPIADQLLILSLHGAKHRWYSLGWIGDIAELLKTVTEPEWDQLMKTARSLGCHRVLYLGLALAEVFFGASIPRVVTAEAGRDQGVQSLVDMVVEDLVWADASEWTSWGASQFYLRSRERLRDRWRFCIGEAFTLTTGDFKCISLPDALFPLYHAVRAVRLAGHYVLPALRKTRMSDG